MAFAQAVVGSPASKSLLARQGRVESVGPVEPVEPVEPVQGLHDAFAY